ncbi:RNA ligase family protein [Cytobacillus pseudoceanisediminis]|uniref:ATP-dependent DNA ligase n=1 Tax=Cytobacillus pseudoceanisediminis TaxID=3051614 RepID=UPI003CEBBF28
MFIYPMLLEKEEEPFSDHNYLFELKLDGHRMIYSFENTKLQLFTRHFTDVTARYPELHILPSHRDYVLDGECIVYANNKPDFELLMERFHTRKEDKVRYKMSEIPVTFVAFDILRLDGKDLTKLPLIQRKQILDEVIKETEHIKIMQYIEEHGELLYQAVVERDLEGIVAKRKDSIYQSKRVNDWLKIVNYKYSDDIWITGYRKSKFGLLAAVKNEGNMRKVGIIEHASITVRRDFYQYIRSFEMREEKDYVYFQPYVKVKIRFLNWNSRGNLRIPVLLEVVH